MIAPRLFPFAEVWWFYAIFTLLIAALLAIDLGVFHKEAHRVSMREATTWAVVWVGVALLFNVGLYFWSVSFLSAHPPAGLTIEEAAKRTAMEFLAGYVVEYSLSVDNLFVFVVVMNYFRIPPELRHRVLFLGILAALVFRGVFVIIGAALLQFQWIVWVLGLFLVVTGVRVMTGDESDQIDPETNWAMKLLRKVLPVTPQFHGDSFFVREGSRLLATPLFVALMFLNIVDTVFAVDSVPAIFGLTNEPLVVFTSNMFAILGLRNLYFLLAGAVDVFHLLKYGLGIVLCFVGLKMTLLTWLMNGHVPIGPSLGFILAVLVISIAGSLLYPKRTPI
ncbi:MAG: TerC family protein [Vicinamibacteria bacterium]|nr:TerC family protein [Vicinamibacteria bacterium]